MKTTIKKASQYQKGDEIVGPTRPFSQERIGWYSIGMLSAGLIGGPRRTEPFRPSRVLGTLHRRLSTFFQIMNSSVTDVLHARMDRLLIEAVSMGASDLHVIVGVPPPFG